MSTPSRRNTLSPSRANDYMNGPLLYRFRVIDKLPEPPSADALKGTLVHSVLEHIFGLERQERTPDRAHDSLQPIWDELKSEYKNKTINGYHVVFTDVNCSEETAEVERMMNQYSIEGYPTIKLLKDGQIIEYDAKPSRDTLVQFLNTVL